jgi:hypothetical protein
MKKWLIFVVMLSGISFTSFAQMYDSSVGVRLGPENGVTFKHFVNDNNAVEVIASLRWRGVNVTGLYEVHKLAFDIDGLFWYFGGGAHVGVWGASSPWHDASSTNNGNFAAGIDGVIGFEYTFREYPINIGIDWKPAINLIGNFHPWVDGSALSVRYIFK